MVKRHFLLGRDVAEPELITDLEARRLWPYGADKVAVRNLSLVANAGFDIWGRMKEQPLQVSVTLALRSPFNSAAKDDKVDSSTVHYGTLSKTVLSAISKASSGGWLDDWTLGSVISAAIVEAVPETNKTLESSAIDVCFPKGSTLGTGTGASWKIFYRPPNQIDDERTLVKVAPCVYLRDVHVPTLIGVNSNEREKKQAVVLNVWIDHTGYFHYGKNHCDLESELVEIMEKSSYETLETLAEQLALHCSSTIGPIVPIRLEGSPRVRIRLEKPSAVPFADAPMIEISRSLTGDP
ncbi:Dihydroneopterin aldolase-domain-containing protein [Phyllosticta capitalensis]|uniref:dihydroneopterin aldolase n=1 Tax=Phyllosticta capitalensis TaxID=121624 RepID=A0ABR1YXA1_9PEZI